MQILKISNTLNTQNNTQRNNVQPKYVTFTANPAKVESKFFAPVKKFLAPAKDYKDEVEEKMAKGIAKYIFDTEPAQWFVRKTKDKKNITAHLSTLTSVVLSGFYVKKTLDSKELETDRKKTLAINLAIVWAVSTALSYALNGVVTKEINKFADKFERINIYKEPAKDVTKWKGGIESAASLMIFGLMFRLIAPVLVTPLANHLGNKLQEKKEAEMIGKKQND